MSSKLAAASEGAEDPLPWSTATRAALQRRLLEWYGTHRRPFPWRQNRDPYRIWVSEVMLQQTTAPVVVPYFERFLAAFPTLDALAQADEQEVLRLWQGLGYYRRARDLHAAARLLVHQHGGQLPDDPALWRSLPGVGRYVCAAVLSQAFDRRLPIVEANSLRVLSRLYGYRGDPRRGAGHRWVWQAAEALLPSSQVGEFNQALMELGSLVCTPRHPRCWDCPWRRWCRAYAQDCVAGIPPPPARPAITPVQELAVLILDGPRLLLCQRPATASRWPSLWEVPHAELNCSATAQPSLANDVTPAVPSPVASTAEAIRQWVRNWTGLEVEPEQPVATVRHSVTRFRITLHAWTARYCRGTFASSFYTTATWITPEQRSLYPLSSPQRRLLERWSQQTSSPRTLLD